MPPGRAALAVVPDVDRRGRKDRDQLVQDRPFSPFWFEPRSEPMFFVHTEMPSAASCKEVLIRAEKSRGPLRRLELG